MRMPKRPLPPPPPMIPHRELFEVGWSVTDENALDQSGFLAKCQRWASSHKQGVEHVVTWRVMPDAKFSFFVLPKVKNITVIGQTFTFKLVVGLDKAGVRQILELTGDLHAFQQIAVINKLSG